MNENQYAAAGWLAVASAVIVLPSILGTLILDWIAKDYPIAKALIAVFQLFGLAVSIYLLYILRRLLNDRYDFHKTDNLITALIWFNAVFTGLGILGLISELEIVAGILVMILFVPFAILDILFAVRLLKLNDDLFGLLKPFAYTKIAAGICGATIILAPLGMLISTASIFIMGMIFLRAKEGVEFV